MKHLFLKTVLVAGTTVGVCLTATDPAQALSIFKSNSTDGFADGSTLTRSVTFTAADFAGGSSSIADTALSIFFAKSGDSVLVPEGAAIASGIPSLNEIGLALTSPDGTTVSLINPGSFNAGANGFRGTLNFLQTATSPVNSDPNTITSGTFLPVTDGGSLSSFAGKSAIGTWNLSISDSGASNGLSFYDFQVGVATDTVQAPTPALIPGLVGLGIAALRKRKQTNNA